MWPDCSIGHGKPRHPQSQGSVERGNADIKDMLVIWMRENNCKKWNIGLKFVQFDKNNSHHSAGINRSPYKSLFGCDAKIGLSSSSLPQEIIRSLETEEDLFQHLESQSESESRITSDKIEKNVSETSTAMSESQGANTEADIQLCPVCENPCFIFVTCSVCANFVHDLCSKACTPESVTCNLCSNEKNITSERRNASESMKRQATRMRNLSERILSDVDIGTNVLIQIPNVDRGKGDPRNVLAVVINKDELGYKLGTKSGTLRGVYTRNQFELSDSKCLDIGSINNENELSLRQAVSSVLLCDALYA
jgi:hypothetical protein